MNSEENDVVYKEINDESEAAIEEMVAELLIEKGLTIATAESCTGGLLAGALINYPGISQAYMEGVVTYSNEAKMNRLGVRKETLDRVGAVSEETAREMAVGIVKAAGTDVGISVTGIAGPGGGTSEKPVGLVYVGLNIKGDVKVKRFNFDGDRVQVRNKTVTSTLEWLKKELSAL
jgi:nicotinamide-nucleotide amidase